MSRVLEATCDGAGKVFCEGIHITTAVILGEGTEASEGILVLDGVKATYIASNASDIKELIEGAASILSSIQSILSGLDGVSTSPGSLAGTIAALTADISAFEATKGVLK